MPRGIYERTKVKGTIKPNSNYRLVLDGKEATCKKHGVHSKWNIYHSNLTARCCMCANELVKEHCKADRFYALYRWSKNRAAKSGREHTITKEYLKTIFDNQNGLCALSGLPLDDKMSLDRIDSSKGYIEGNVQLVHYHVNAMKLDTPNDIFIELCVLIAENAASIGRKKYGAEKFQKMATAGKKRATKAKKK